ncbi:Transcriptional regulator, TetR family protein [Minicystis rosea]|nr:Transcriptional regulator, TetR family protein [Minicystis rosea]
MAIGSAKAHRRSLLGTYGFLRVEDRERPGPLSSARPVISSAPPMPAPIKRRTQVERKDEAERRMLEAGVRLAAVRGLDQVTLNEVGEAAGYSRGLPAHHFGTKEAFREQLLAFVVREFRAHMEASRQDAGLSNLEALLMCIFERARSDSLHVSVVQIVLTELRSRPELSDEVRELRETTFATIERNLRAGVRRGEIRRGTNVRLTSQVLIASACGVLELALADADIDVQQAGGQLVRMILDGLRAPP